MKQLSILLIAFLAPFSAQAHSLGEHFHPHLGWEHLLLALVIGIGLTQKRTITKLFSRKKK